MGRIKLWHKKPETAQQAGFAAPVEGIGNRKKDSIFGERKGGLARRWFANGISIVIIVIAVVALLSCTLTASRYYSDMESRLESAARTSASYIESYISDDYSEFYQSCIELTRSYEDADVIELQFIDRNGALVASSFTQWSGYTVTEQDVTDALESGILTSFTGNSSMTGEHILAVSVPLVYSSGETVGVLRYVTGLRLADRQVLLLCIAIVSAALVLVLFVIFGSIIFLHSILEPVEEITRTAKRIAAGSYGSHIQKISPDEIGVLAETINEMSDAVSRTERMQTELVSSVSHELRTPLTVITGWGETLVSDPDMPREDMERGMNIILSEARRLTGMVEELLEFSRIQDGRMILNVERCDLRAELEDTIFMYAAKLKAEGILLDYLENDDDVPELPCDTARMKQVFLNILDNAVKHGGGAKGRITVEIRRIGQEFSIQVRDFGPGIPEDELPYVKSRFYKGSSKARGNGIGLAVCDEIVKLHNGTLTLSNAEGGGTLVDVRIPLDEETDEDRAQ